MRQVLVRKMGESGDFIVAVVIQEVTRDTNCL